MTEHDFFRPKLPSLEQDCRQDTSRVVRRLDDFYMHNNGPIIDERIDMLAPDVEISYLEGLTACLGGRSNEQFLTTHAAFHFAAYVASLLNWQVDDIQSVLPRLTDVLQDMKLSEARDFIMSTAREYLRTRPQLERLYAQYSHRIDPNDTFLFEAGAVYGLTLRQIEVSCVQKYMQETDGWYSDGDG